MSDKTPLELADAFCKRSRRRIKDLHRAVYCNDDKSEYALARKFLSGEFIWLEDGIISTWKSEKEKKKPVAKKAVKKSASTKTPAKPAAAKSVKTSPAKAISAKKTTAKKTDVKTETKKTASKKPARSTKEKEE